MLLVDLLTDIFFIMNSSWGYIKSITDCEVVSATGTTKVVKDKGLCGVLPRGDNTKESGWGTLYMRDAVGVLRKQVEFFEKNESFSVQDRESPW